MSESTESDQLVREDSHAQETLPIEIALEKVREALSGLTIEECRRVLRSVQEEVDVVSKMQVFRPLHPLA